MYLRSLCYVMLLLSFSSFAQEKKTKQHLLEIVSKPVHDTILLDAYNELIWPIYSYDIPDSSFYFGEKAIALATKINDIKRLSISHRRLGITYSNIGDIKTSIQHQQLSYDLSEKINFKRGMQLALNNMGVAYLNNEILNKALSYFLRSLKLAEETKNNSGVEQIYYNCALIYSRTGDLTKSKVFILKAIEQAGINQDSAMLLICYSGLSTNFRNQLQIDSASHYLNIAKKYLVKESGSGSKFGYYLNEGLLLAVSGQHQKALDQFIFTKRFATVTNDQITVLINIAEEHLKLKHFDKALEVFYQAYDLSLKTKTYNNLTYLSLSMARIYENLNNYKKFTEFINLHLNYKDSNDKYIKVQQIQQQQLEFDFERKQVADSLRFEHLEKLKNKELEISSEKLNNEKIVRMMLLIMLIGIVFFALFTFNRLKLTKKQKLIIEKQKQLVELKNHEMLDSINYAKRLQSAILPQVEDIKKLLQLELFYLPKDIIGGDFYFFEKYKGHTFFAVCDCTGHGVPGALMSVVCHQSLQKAIKEFNLTEPGLILSKTRQLVIENLNAKNQNIRDGMDCSLLVINDTTQEMLWSGANNHSWIIQSGELLEIKADKQPVAFYENEKEFTTHTLHLNKDSILVLFTDGYGDQFGGPKGKKFKNKNIKELLLKNQHKTITEQKEMLEINFKNWKNELEQVDDVSIALIYLV